MWKSLIVWRIKTPLRGIWLHPNSPPVAPLTISPLPQLTFDVQILHVFISFGTLLIFDKKCLNFSCIQLWTVVALKMCLETQWRWFVWNYEPTWFSTIGVPDHVVREPRSRDWGRRRERAGGLNQASEDWDGEFVSGCFSGAFFDLWIFYGGWPHRHRSLGCFCC